MAYDPFQPQGQQVMASSLGVVVASNQTPVSVAGTLNIAGNPSISGTVNISGNPSISGSVNVGGGFTAADGATPNGWQFGVGTQGYATTIPFIFNGTNYDRQRGNSSVGAFVHIGAGSVITTVQGSVATVIIGGSIAASFTPPANQSVSGTVDIRNNSSVISYVPNSIAAVIIGGSIAASFTPPANQSVSGSVGIVGNPSISGTVNTIPTGTIITSVVSTVPSSMLVGASIIGLTPVAITNTPSISGTVNIAGNPSISGTVLVNNGSVVAFQGTTPWLIGSVYGNISGSIAGTYLEPAVVTSVTGLAMMFKTNISTSTMGVISATNPLPINGSVSGSVNIAGNPSISGTVLVNNGSVVAFQGTSPWIETFSNSSILAVPVGSVITVPTGSVITVFQSSSVITTWKDSSILAVPVGSTITVFQNSSLLSVQSGASSTSIVGSIPSSTLVGIYAQRNDAVASALGADLTWRPLATDSAGRNLIKLFAADENRLDTQTSVVSGSVTALFNSVVGLRQYVTDIMVANTGSVATLVTFKDGSTSVLGYTIAPAGGGSNIIGMSFPFRTAPAQDFAFTVSPSTSILYISAKGYKAP